MERTPYSRGGALFSSRYLGVLVAKKEKPAETKPAETKPAGPCVAPGRSVTSLRGLLGPGTVVSARDFACGEESLQALIDCGAVVKG